MLMARTIRSKPGLGSIDVAINRPDPRQPPVGIYSAHIDSGEAIISEGVIGAWTQFTELFRIKNCQEVCIEYDGSWAKSSLSSYDFYTINDPYILFTSSTSLGISNLYVQQANGVPIQLASGKIGSISLCRGWKSLVDETQDQGLIAAYVLDGRVYYRALVTKGMTSVWEQAVPLSLPYTDVEVIRVQRTNDYRVLFTGTLSSGEHFMAYSSRCWAGFSVEPEVVSRTEYAGQLTTTPINSIEVPELSEYITRGETAGVMHAKSVTQPTVITGKNLDESTIDIIHGTDLVTTDLAVLTANLFVQDSRNRKYNILSVTQLRAKTRLKTIKFNNVVGPLTIFYNGEGGLTTVLGEPVAAFKITFIPTGLVPDVVDPPQVVKIININNDEGVTAYEL